MPKPNTLLKLSIFKNVFWVETLYKLQYNVEAIWNEILNSKDSQY